MGAGSIVGPMWSEVPRLPNARYQPRPKAVGCMPWFGGGSQDREARKNDNLELAGPSVLPHEGASSLFGDENPLGFWFRPVVIVVPALHCNLAEAHGLQHHGKLVSVIPPHPMRPQLRLDQMPFFEDLMTHPDMLNLLDTVGYRRFVDEDGRPIGGAHP